ncbi:MAG: hypothetical protein R2762_10115 [Bryobacteraceae bacterium]
MNAHPVRLVPHYVANQAALLPKMRVAVHGGPGGRVHPTVPWEVVDMDRRTVRRDGAGMVPLALSSEAMKRGAVRLDYPAIQVNHANLGAFFQDWVYEGRTLSDIFRPGFYLGMGVMLIEVVPDVAWDMKAQEVLEAWKRECAGRRCRRATSSTRSASINTGSGGLGIR